MTESRPLPSTCFAFPPAGRDARSPIAIAVPSEPSCGPLRCRQTCPATLLRPPLTDRSPTASGLGAGAASVTIREVAMPTGAGDAPDVYVEARLNHANAREWVATSAVAGMYIHACVHTCMKKWCPSPAPLPAAFCTGGACASPAAGCRGIRGAAEGTRSPVYSCSPLASSCAIRLRHRSQPHVLLG